MKIPGNANLQIGVPLFECESEASLLHRIPTTHLNHAKHTRHFVVAGACLP